MSVGCFFLAIQSTDVLTSPYPFCVCLWVCVLMCRIMLTQGYSVSAWVFCGSLWQHVFLCACTYVCEGVSLPVFVVLCVSEHVCLKNRAAWGMLVVGWVKHRGQLSLWNMLLLISVTRPNRVMNQHKAWEFPDWAAASSHNTCSLLWPHLLPL